MANIDGCLAGNAVQLLESDSKYTILVQLPNLRKQDICVSLDCNRVTIAAERAPLLALAGRPPAKPQIIHSLLLEQTIDTVKAYATYRGCELELVLPKSSKGCRRLVIN